MIKTLRLGVAFLELDQLGVDVFKGTVSGSFGIVVRLLVILIGDLFDEVFLPYHLRF